MLLIEDLERYIYDKDTKKIAENKAVRELFCPVLKGRERQLTTEPSGSDLILFFHIYEYGQQVIPR